MKTVNVTKFPERPKSQTAKSQLLDTAIDDLNGFRFKDAERILVELVDGGYDEAYLYLGMAYELNADKNPLLDYEKAYFYYDMSIETTGLVEAYVAKAYMHTVGLINNSEVEEAVNIYRELLDNDIHLEGFVYCALGKLHFFGELGEVNMDEAEINFKKGWKLGHVPCLNGLSSVFLKQKRYLLGVPLKIFAVSLGVTIAILNKNSSRIRQV